MIFFKIIIYICIFCITSYIGIEMSNSLKSREEILIEMITFLTLLQNEITYTLNSLPVSYEIARKRLGTNLKNVIGAISVDMSEFSKDKVDISITNNVNTLIALTEYDKEVIISILKNLGRSDLTSQKNIIENGIVTLKRQVKEAAELKEKNSKVYKTIGVITGLMIIVIFI